MHDALTLEQKGIPCALICTEPFVHTALVMAEQIGLKDYPMIIIDHPIGRLNEQDLQARINQAIPNVLRRLGSANQ